MGVGGTSKFGRFLDSDNLFSDVDSDDRLRDDRYLTVAPIFALLLPPHAVHRHDARRGIDWIDHVAHSFVTG